MFKAADKWLPGYLAWLVRRLRQPAMAEPVEVFFCLADHFEPFRGGVEKNRARGLVRQWLDEYRRRLAPYRDADGKAPRHVFFYPAEEADDECLEALAAFCAEGWGEVEIHLHHRGDTTEGLARHLVDFRDRLHEKHGLLGCDAAGAPRYGFIHGNWALCNSRPDGDWCGVNEELGVLARTGCYADFTFPSAPSPTQPRTVNTIYYARDRDGHPRGADVGVPATAGRERSPNDGLMIVPGPLGLNWRRRKWGWLPRLENAELTRINPATPERIALWIWTGIHVRGRPQWIFVKVHTHGLVPENEPAVIGEAACLMHETLGAGCAGDLTWRLHYVTAREMYNLIKAAEKGCDGPPHRFRDAVVGPPPIIGRR